MLHVQVSDPGVGGGKDTNSGLMVGDQIFFPMQLNRKNRYISKAQTSCLKYEVTDKLKNGSI